MWRDEQEFGFEPVKLDRKKLYGWIERAALDPQGKTCSARPAKIRSKKISGCQTTIETNKGTTNGRRDV